MTLFLVLLLTCAWSAIGQDTVIQLTDLDKTDIVQAHNSLRKAVQPPAASMKEVVRWLTSSSYTMHVYNVIITTTLNRYGVIS